MNNNLNINNIKEITQFYDDCKNIFMKRIETYSKKRKDNLDEENKYNRKISQIQNEINEIKKERENHINNNIDYCLKPSQFREVDKLEKKILYLQEELDYMKKVHDEENKFINEEIEKNKKKFSQFNREKFLLIECINASETLNVEKVILIVNRIKEQVERENNAIFEKYTKTNH